MTDDKVSVVTCTAPVNIAVIKYWGKRDEELILPINGSVSVTLDQEQLCAKTSVAVSKRFTEDRMWLNGKEEPTTSPRIQNVLKEIRRRARKRRSGDQVDLSTLTSHVHICSENNFPTAAGLASSAAGFSCLVFALAKLFGVTGDISEIARQGSGSACRSVYGGFVEWIQGASQDGSDSIAQQVAPHNHWPDMHVLILVVSSGRKSVGSSEAMRRSVASSGLLSHRAESIVPARITQIKDAIINRDFHTFAELTMKDSNQFHACCLDTYPPVFYLTDTSRAIIQLVHAVNDYYTTNKVAYTFDAGPNACLYLMKEDVPLILGIIQHFFPSSHDNGDTYIRGLQCQPQSPSQVLLDALSGHSPHKPGSLQYILHTKVGPGPIVLREEESLLGEDGLPLTH